MKTRDVIGLCAALVVGAAPITAAGTVAATRPGQGMVAQTTPAPTATKPARATASKASTVDPIEARITDLHAKLNITPAQ